MPFAPRRPAAFDDVVERCPVDGSNRLRAVAAIDLALENELAQPVGRIMERPLFEDIKWLHHAPQVIRERGDAQSRPDSGH